MADDGPVATPTDAAAALAGSVRAAEALSGRERTEALRAVLRSEVHEVALHASAGPEGRAADLADLAAAVREHVPAGVEDGLNPRVTVFVRLLRRGALEPAWTLAHDNASGVVRGQTSAATWAGGSTLSTPLALPTQIDGDEIYAWLPGFRDPRWNVPDSVYSLTDRVVLRREIQLAAFRSGALELSGVGYLGLLEAGPADVVDLELAGPDGARIAVRAHRRRRPSLVRARGPELTRLAWGGWFARLELAALAERPGRWRLGLSVTQQGVHRMAGLAPRSRPGAPALVDDVLVDGPHRYRLDASDPDGLVVEAGPNSTLRRVRGLLHTR